MRCFNQTIALFHLDHRIVSVYHSYSFFYNPLPQLEFLKKSSCLIFIDFRGQQVMLDKDLATLYGVETKVLNQTVKRNIERFPNDFRFNSPTSLGSLSQSKSANT